MRQCNFVISWIYGEFKVLCLKQGRQQAYWQANLAVVTAADLQLALQQAAEAIDFNKGGDLSVIYEAEDHSHELLQLPQMSNKDLKKVLARKAEQLKPFSSPASWCYHQAPLNKSEDGILLHILPQAIVDVVVEVCQQFNLRPKQLLPLSEIVSSIVPAYELCQSEYMVLVALFEQHTEVFVVSNAGEIIFARSLSYCGYGDGCERLAIDINRTLRYAKQQFHQTIEQVCLVGDRAAELMLQLGKVEARVDFALESCDAYFWARASVSLKQQASANFIPLMAQRQINKKLLQRWLLLSTPALVAASISSVVYVETRLLKLDTSLPELRQEIRQLEGEIGFYDKLSAEVEGKQQELNILQASSQNLPALLLNNMPDILPNGLVLKQLSMRQQHNSWQLSIAASSSLELHAAEAAMRQFERQMRSPPWNFSMANNWQKELYQQLKSGQQDLDGRYDFAINARVN